MLTGGRGGGQNGQKNADVINERPLRSFLQRDNSGDILSNTKTKEEEVQRKVKSRKQRKLTVSLGGVNA